MRPCLRRYTLIVTITVFGVVGAAVTPVSAGGLYVPGTGTESTARAGASVAEVAGADALDINPAGLANERGTQVDVSTTFLKYDVSFTRFGRYASGTGTPWAGQAFPTVSNSAQPEFGIGNYLALPLVSIVSDLHDLVPGLHVAFGFYVPSNTDPVRNIDGNYQLGDPHVAPPPSRYDTMQQDGVFLLPSIGVGYHVSDKLDVGARFSAGIASLNAKLAIWAAQNYPESSDYDVLFNGKVTDDFVWSTGLGAQYHASRNLEFGATWNSQMNVDAAGAGSATISPTQTTGSVPVTITAPVNGNPRCQAGGSGTALRACIEFALPMTASVGGRYIVRDRDGVERGDLELDGTWENWSSDRVTNNTVVADAVIDQAITLNDMVLRHGFRDTYGVRLGGAYKFAVGPGTLIARSGVAYDTAAAQAGWERLQQDGAARTTFAAGVGYAFDRFEFDFAAMYVYEGTRAVGSLCQPSTSSPGCNGTGMDTPVDQRMGADPLYPVVNAQSQTEDPINHGIYTSNYLALSLGIKTWF